MCGFVPLQLPAITFNNNEIKIENSVKFLGVMIIENLTWIDHIKVTQNKIYKNAGILYRVCHLAFWKSISPSFTFTSATAWLILLPLKGILRKQNHVAQIIFHANRFNHSRPLLKEMKTLNVFQINII